MATNERFIHHVTDLAGLGDRFSARKMFGEYGLYLDGKLIALACDDSLFIKETGALSRHRLDLPLKPPYPGAKLYPVADELLDEPKLFREVLLETATLLPEPKSKPKKKSAAKSGTKAGPKSGTKKKNP